MTPESSAPEYNEPTRPVSHPPEPPVLNETEARQAVLVGHMRYVLGISLALVIIAFAVVYLTYFRTG